ncbi:MAG: DEAD/DEAH box helicase, partial [Microbacteriaceae bacterium]|nr:DEAD/DEAH box helicase [Microbacteriaceae bacterium]
MLRRHTSEATPTVRTMPALRGTLRRSSMTAIAEPQQVLREVFGFDSFRGDQAAIVQQVTDGGDAVVLMPTGGGKSLCYQVPALCRTGTAVVLSPLVALMHDQVSALQLAGVRAGSLNSAMTSEQRDAVSRAYLAGELDLLYLA